MRLWATNIEVVAETVLGFVIAPFFLLFAWLGALIYLIVSYPFKTRFRVEDQDADS